MVSDILLLKEVVVVPDQEAVNMLYIAITRARACLIVFVFVTKHTMHR